MAGFKKWLKTVQGRATSVFFSRGIFGFLFTPRVGVRLVDYIQTFPSYVYDSDTPETDALGFEPPFFVTENGESVKNRPDGLNVGVERTTGSGRWPVGVGIMRLLRLKSSAYQEQIKQMSDLWGELDWRNADVSIVISYHGSKNRYFNTYGITTAPFTPEDDIFGNNGGPMPVPGGDTPNWFRPQKFLARDRNPIVDPNALETTWMEVVLRFGDEIYKHGELFAKMPTATTYDVTDVKDREAVITGAAVQAHVVTNTKWLVCVVFKDAKAGGNEYRSDHVYVKRYIQDETVGVFDQAVYDQLVAEFFNAGSPLPLADKIQNIKDELNKWFYVGAVDGAMGVFDDIESVEPNNKGLARPLLTENGGHPWMFNQSGNEARCMRKFIENAKLGGNKYAEFAVGGVLTGYTHTFKDVVGSSGSAVADTVYYLNTGLSECILSVDITPTLLADSEILQAIGGEAYIVSAAVNFAHTEQAPIKFSSSTYTETYGAVSHAITGTIAPHLSSVAPTLTDDCSKGHEIGQIWVKDDGLPGEQKWQFISMTGGPSFNQALWSSVPNGTVNGRTKWDTVEGATGVGTAAWQYTDYKLAVDFINDVPVYAYQDEVISSSINESAGGRTPIILPSSGPGAGPPADPSIPGNSLNIASGDTVFSQVSQVDVRLSGGATRRIKANSFSGSGTVDELSSFDGAICRDRKALTASTDVTYSEPLKNEDIVFMDIRHNILVTQGTWGEHGNGWRIRRHRGGLESDNSDLHDFEMDMHYSRVAKHYINLGGAVTEISGYIEEFPGRIYNDEWYNSRSIVTTKVVEFSGRVVGYEVTTGEPAPERYKDMFYSILPLEGFFTQTHLVSPWDCMSGREDQDRIPLAISRTAAPVVKVALAEGADGYTFDAQYKVPSVRDWPAVFEFAATDYVSSNYFGSPHNNFPGSFETDGAVYFASALISGKDRAVTALEAAAGMVVTKGVVDVFNALTGGDLDALVDLQAAAGESKLYFPIKFIGNKISGVA